MTLCSVRVFLMETGVLEENIDKLKSNDLLPMLRCSSDVFSCCYSDLIHTTESLRNTKLSAGKTEEETRTFDALLEPYRAENARVVRENNQLHLELLKLKEEKDRVGRGKPAMSGPSAFLRVSVRFPHILDPHRAGLMTPRDLVLFKS